MGLDTGSRGANNPKFVAKILQKCAGKGKRKVAVILTCHGQRKAVPAQVIKIAAILSKCTETSYTCALLDRKMCPKKATRAGRVPKNPAQNHLFSYQLFVTA